MFVLQDFRYLLLPSPMSLYAIYFNFITIRNKNEYINNAILRVKINEIVIDQVDKT